MNAGKLNTRRAILAVGLIAGVLCSCSDDDDNGGVNIQTPSTYALIAMESLR